MHVFILSTEAENSIEVQDLNCSADASSFLFRQRILKLSSAGVVTTYSNS